VQLSRADRPNIQHSQSRLDERIETETEQLQLCKRRKATTTTLTLALHTCTLAGRTMSASEGYDNSARRPRSNSRSRPTTPLRPSSRSSFRESAHRSVDGHEPFPLNTFEPAFAELADAVADLEVNMMHFQLMHESLARFGESFASFLYGLNMNAFCVDFPEVSEMVDCYNSKVGRLADVTGIGASCRVIS
jgi:hypothetical protein